jgi:hypothetical protein
MLPEAGLAAATNGEVWSDRVGAFTRIRTQLLSFYPEDLRLKKLAAKCALAAQSGQYNYPRCLRRGDRVAAYLALGQFLENVQAAVFLLNRRFMPYYKWSQRALRTLPVLGAEIAPLLDALAAPVGGDGGDPVEHVAALLIGALRREGLSDARDGYLLPHAEAVQRRIANADLRALHIMAE